MAAVLLGVVKVLEQRSRGPGVGAARGRRNSPAVVCGSRLRGTKPLRARLHGAKCVVAPEAVWGGRTLLVGGGGWSHHGRYSGRCCCGDVGGAALVPADLCAAL